MNKTICIGLQACFLRLFRWEISYNLDYAIFFGVSCRFAITERNTTRGGNGPWAGASSRSPLQIFQEKKTYDIESMVDHDGWKNFFKSKKGIIQAARKKIKLIDR